MSLLNDEENEMCQICEAQEMFARYFERAGKCRWRREDRNLDMEEKNPMDCHHRCCFEILHLVASCLSFSFVGG